MNKKYSILGLSILLLSAGSKAAAQVNLTPPIGGDVLPGGNVAQSSIRTGLLFSRLIPFAIRYLVGLGAALAVLALMIGGYQYLTAYGDTEKHKSAVQTVIWALLGLALCITAYAIVALVTSFRFGS